MATRPHVADTGPRTLTLARVRSGPDVRASVAADAELMDIGRAMPRTGETSPTNSRTLSAAPESPRETAHSYCHDGAELTAPDVHTLGAPTCAAMLGAMLAATGAELTDLDGRGAGIVATFEVSGATYRLQLDPMAAYGARIGERRSGEDRRA